MISVFGVPGFESSGMVNCRAYSCKMGARSGMRLALAVVLMALSTPVACVAQSYLNTMNTQWQDNGHITFYGSPNGGGTLGGACAYQNTVALGYGMMTAALSSPLFNGGEACGACYEIKCKYIQETNTAKNWCYSYTKSIIVTATNLCPPGSTGGWCNPPNCHFDLPMPAFLQLAQQQGGVAPVYYRRTPCQRSGGMRFTLGGNQWFMMILIHNVAGAGDVVAVSISCPYVGWTPMYRNWGAIWTCTKPMHGPLSFKVTTGDGITTIVSNAVGNGWQFGQTWEGNVNCQ